MAAAKPNSQTTDSTEDAKADVKPTTAKRAEKPADPAQVPADETLPEADGSVEPTVLAEKSQRARHAAAAPDAESKKSTTFGSWAITYSEAALALTENVRAALDDLSETHQEMFTHVPANPASTMHVRRLYSALADLSLAVNGVNSTAGGLASHAVENEPQS